MTNHQGVALAFGLPISFLISPKVYPFILFQIDTFSDIPPPEVVVLVNLVGLTTTTESASTKSCNAIPTITKVFLFAFLLLEIAQTNKVPMIDTNIRNISINAAHIVLPNAADFNVVAYK